MKYQVRVGDADDVQLRQMPEGSPVAVEINGKFYEMGRVDRTTPDGIVEVVVDGDVSPDVCNAMGLEPYGTLILNVEDYEIVQGYW
jgi:hypothetical protein